MKAIHVNLLRQSEVLSSSPIRLRVMIPVAAMLATAGMVLWWVMIYSAVLLNMKSISSTEQEITARRSGHEHILAQMDEANELEAELEQLDYYRGGIHRWGDTFTHLAEVIPLKVQITRIEIPAPPPQKLVPPSPKAPPVWGPQVNTESVMMILTGRTTKETPVISMMESLETDAFTNSLVICKDPNAPVQSPRVTSFRQDNSTVSDDSRQKMLAFEIEYTAKERRFAR